VCCSQEVTAVPDLSRRQWLALAGTGAAAVLGAKGMAQPPPEEDAMVLIPAGKCLVGTTEEQAERLARRFGYHVTWLSGEYPQRQVELPAFLIDKYPVTNRQFAEFCQAIGHPPRPHWPNGKPPEALLDHPVVCVNRADALAFCAWVGKRLPTEAEWEKAARGEQGLAFPWGNEFDPEACQWNPEKLPGPVHTAPVSAHPKGASPYGVVDMVGNVAEWCADPPPPHGGLRGGCWLTSEVINLRAAARNMNGFDNNAATFYGFRCAEDVE
jgi:formylglycine-generating enzyme required for sulfatase activity